MNTQMNPYVGPRTFLKEEGHLFFGRDREARDLSALVASDQLVLFYAQSGAGKSSLINTRLIPELEDKLYEVLPVARVSGNWPEGDETHNIYIYNLIRSLIRREIESNSLVDLTLSQFLAKLNEDEGGYFYDGSLTTDIRGTEDFIPWRRALIIDQFEELFSTHPEAWEKRGDFFNQLAQAMQEDPYLWVVIVMREDYIAALDPYAHILPGGLRTRYYMQRLSREAAIKAVRKPVEDVRPYEAGVAEKLVEDLSSIKVQKPDGSQEFQPGQYVEPVQLQVVCYGLWQNLPAEGTRITEKDLLEVGDVDEALGNYFAGRVAGVAQAKHVKERLIRDWIEKKLIAPGGIRSMVLQETNRKTGGISDDVIQALQSDLVRAENRGGTLWYELTHDRLVGPILENNKKWFDENLSPLQRQASIWNDQERNESWLLRDQALVEVEEWARANPDEMTELETDFLEDCRKQQEQIKLGEQVRSARRAARFTTVAGTLGLIAIIAAVFAFVFGQRAIASAAEADVARATAQSGQVTAQAASTEASGNAELAVVANNTAQAASTSAVQQADRATSGSLVAQADSLSNVNYPLALLLGMEAYERDPNNLLTRTALFQLLQFTPYRREFGFSGYVSSVAVSPDGTLIAAASCQTRQCAKGNIKLYDADMMQARELSDADFGPVYTLAFSPDGNTLAAGGCVPAGCSISQGQISFWDVSDLDKPVWLSETVTGHTALVKTIAFSPDGKILASGSYDTSIILWDIATPETPRQASKPMSDHSSFVNSLTFSPDGKLLVSASDAKTIRLWNVSNPGSSVLLVPTSDVKHTLPITSIALSRGPDDTTKFASVSDDGTVILWGWDATQRRPLINPTILKGHTGYLKSVAFNQDGTILASAGFDNRIFLWDTSTHEQIGPPLSVHTSAINTIAFGVKVSQDKELPYLVSGSNDRTMIRWELSVRQPLSRTSVSEGELPPNSQSNGLYTASSIAQRVEVKTDDEEVFLTLGGFDSPVKYVGFEGPVLLTMDQNQQEASLNSIDQNQLDPPWITRWSIDPNDWVSLACDAVTQNLSELAREQLWSEFVQKLPPNEPPAQECITKP